MNRILVSALLLILVGLFGLPPFLRNFWSFIKDFITTPVGFFTVISAFIAVISALISIYNMYLSRSACVIASFRVGNTKKVFFRFQNTGKIIAHEVKVEFENEFISRFLNLDVSWEKETVSTMLRLVSNKRNINPGEKEDIPICFDTKKFKEVVSNTLPKTKIKVSWDFGCFRREAVYVADFVDEFFAEDDKNG